MKKANHTNDKGSMPTTTVAVQSKPENTSARSFLSVALEVGLDARAAANRIMESLSVPYQLER